MTDEFNTVYSNLESRVESLLSFHKSDAPPYDDSSTASTKWHNSYYFQIEDSWRGDMLCYPQEHIIEELKLEFRYNTTVSGVTVTMKHLHSNRDKIRYSLLTNPVSGIYSIEWQSSDYAYLEGNSKYIVDTSIYHIDYLITT